MCHRSGLDGVFLSTDQRNSNSRCKHMNFRSSSTGTLRLIFIILLIVAALYACLATSASMTFGHIGSVHAQNRSSGEWTASVIRDAADHKVQLTFNLRSSG